MANARRGVDGFVGGQLSASESKCTLQQLHPAVAARDMSCHVVIAVIQSSWFVSLASMDTGLMAFTRLHIAHCTHNRRGL